MHQLTPAERLQAETALLRALKAPSDPRPLLGLAYLGSRRALLTLHCCLALRGQHSWGVHILRAIAKIDPAALNQQLLLHELTPRRSHQALFSDPLIDLLLGLRLYFPLHELAPPIIDQIFQLLRHEKALVRSHALQTLRQLHALPTAAQKSAADIERSVNDPIFQLICSDGKPDDYKAAICLLRQQIESSSPS